MLDVFLKDLLEMKWSDHFSRQVAKEFEVRKGQLLCLKWCIKKKVFLMSKDTV